ncbi:MAG: ABC transporter ATP-binding protein/permease [Chloroflexi bacterium]|nr:ABC transporter ATP-binding protein/permease [Chloroflexota bacterium]MCI0643706.1 ABC transporter ATP-binding protein/permease [Chloroflexota bacterium]MCI0729754.1 ABC transporter ATP-binding protein/permease [Chloroflexota bacterium]
MAAQTITSKTEFHVESAYQHNQSSPIRWILSHLGRYKWLLALFFIGMTVTNIFNAAIPRQIGAAFNVVVGEAPVGEAIVSEPFQAITVFSLVIFGLVAGRLLCDSLASFSMEMVAKRLERDGRDELYLNLLGKSQTFHNRQRVGDIMARAANDMRFVNEMMMPGFSLMYDSMMALLVPIIFIGFIDARLLLAPLAFCVGYYFAVRHYMRQLEPISDEVRARFGDMNATLNEAVTGIEVVKAAAQEKQEMGKFIHDARRYRNAFVKQGEVQARYIPTLLIGVAIAGAFVHGVYLFNRGEITIGDLIAYLGLMWVLRWPAFSSFFTFYLVQMGIAGAERILELLKAETELDENAAGYTAAMRGEIVFEKVSFRYSDSGRNLLDNISFQARPGETIAIVGQTGSGKTTLTKLVNRTYDVNGGRLLIDGVDVREWNLDSLRSQISIIEQDVFLFSRTVAENIAFGLGQQVSREDIVRAAKEAQAHHFISHFKDGYDTVVGERGVTLSGGQRQRIAIARALLTDPRILILDDATSAIDSATEDEIQKAIKRILEGRTTLLITHRLSQIRRADRVLLIRQGRIVAQGPHQELMATSELYRRIFARYDI